MRRKYHYLFLSTFFYCALANGAGSTGNYVMDLGQVHGAINGVEAMKDVCSKHHPEYDETNSLAYTNWRKKYRKFLQEIERRFLQMQWNQAGGDPEKHMEVMNLYDNYFDRYRKGLERQMLSDGKKVFKKTCKIFPAYLEHKRTDLENFYSEQVETIRNHEE